MAQALLSIGIIFKDHIKTLERCLKSLQPLRDAVPCQLVMGDTGSSDGSRELAEQYADIIVDFPWINDFSAARNAVMDACSSKWHFVLDVDEWLDEDISQLVGFLTNTRRTGKKINFCSVIQRNYSAYENMDRYSDFAAVRMVRMSTGQRYHGLVHESWDVVANEMLALTRTVLHHDGYVGLNTDAGRQKRARNMALLKEELKKNPNDLRRLLQCVESSGGDSDHDEHVRRALEGVRQKLPQWRVFGPSIYADAIRWAVGIGQEELESIAKEALELFPDSLQVRLDVQYVFSDACHSNKDYEKAIPPGEAYLRVLADYRAGRFSGMDLHGSFFSVPPVMENHMRLVLAQSCFQVKDYQRSMEHLAAADLEKLAVGEFKNYIEIMINLQAQSGDLDLSGIISGLWDYLEGLDEKDPKTAHWKNFLTVAAAGVFPQNFRDNETAEGYRHAYTIFLPLAGKSEFGTAAQVLEAADTAEIEGLLGTVENWNMFPIPALAYAIDRGVPFPLPDKPLKMEEMDGLARRLAMDKESFFPMARRALAEDYTANTQRLLWARGLSMAAVRAFDWKPKDEDKDKNKDEDKDKDEEKEVDVDTGLSVARSFAQTEKAFLPFCYSPQVLREETLSVLPPMHRFGWYCVQAFDALDSGDAAGCVRSLRSGLDACNTMKEMVEFLLDRVEEMERASRIAEAPPELIELARQVKLTLSRFAPNDPAVVELKNSPAYQQVAWLIEEPATKAEKIVQ